jgi:hypothetical protein
VRRILTLAGYDLRLGKPDAADDVLVWGHSPYAPRGEAAAKSTGAAIVRVEDAFLRSLHPGPRRGAADRPRDRPDGDAFRRLLPVRSRNAAFPPSP